MLDNFVMMLVYLCVVAMIMGVYGDPGELMLAPGSTTLTPGRGVSDGTRPRRDTNDANAIPHDWLEKAAAQQNAVFGLRGAAILISCTSTHDEELEFINPAFIWRDVTDHVLTDSRQLVQASGDLRVIDLEADDSGQYSCDVTSLTTTSIFTHNLIVYVIPTFQTEVYLEYDVADCSDTFVSMKTSHLQLELCPLQPCVFAVRVRCVLKRKQNSAGRAELRHLLLVTITQTIHPDFRPPSCEVMCIKTSILNHLDERYVKIAEVLDKEKTSAGMGFKFVGDTVTKQLVYSCTAGYHPHAAQACLPCVPGMYSEQGDAACIPCPENTYQPKFAQSRCVPCNKGSTTKGVGANHPANCTDLSKLTLTLSLTKEEATTDGALVGLLVVMVTVVVVVLCIVANKKKAVIRNYLVNRGGPLAPLLMDDMKEAMQKKSPATLAAASVKTDSVNKRDIFPKHTISRSSQVTPRLNASETTAPFTRSISMLSELVHPQEHAVRRDSSGRWGVKPSQSPVPKHRRISQLASQDSRRFSSAPPSVVEGDSTAHNTQGRQLAHDNSGYQGGQYSLEPGFRHQGAQHRNPDVQMSTISSDYLLPVAESPNTRRVSGPPESRPSRNIRHRETGREVPHGAYVGSGSSSDSDGPPQYDAPPPPVMQREKTDAAPPPAKYYRSTRKVSLAPVTYANMDNNSPDHQQWNHNQNARDDVVTRETGNVANHHPRHVVTQQPSEIVNRHTGDVVLPRRQSRKASHRKTNPSGPSFYSKKDSTSES